MSTKTAITEATTPKKLNLAIDYKHAKTDKDNTPNEEITANYLRYFVNQKYPQGLQGQMMRIFGRLQVKLDDALEDGKKSITLDAAEVDFVKKIFKDEEDLKFPAGESKYFVKFMDEITSLF